MRPLGEMQEMKLGKGTWKGSVERKPLCKNCRVSYFGVGPMKYITGPPNIFSTLGFDTVLLHRHCFVAERVSLVLHWKGAIMGVATVHLVCSDSVVENRLLVVVGVQ